jgi:Protein of unknown function (DUF4019)
MANFRRRAIPVLRMHVAVVLLCGMGLLVTSCGSSKQHLELAQRNVEQFHTQLDTEQYTAIYASCDDKFHQITSESDFTKLLEAIHRKLGNVQHSDLKNKGVAWYSGEGATVTLIYETKFAEGTGTERFIWHVKDNGAMLYGYHINSNDLITR